MSGNYVMPALTTK